MVGASLDAYHYSYPPVLLLLLTTPLALMAHCAGAARVAGGGLVRFLSRTASGDAGPRRAAARAGRAAVFINAVGGQNSTWTAALSGSGLSLLERRPLLAGGLLGLLIYKPQLGLLIPVALLAGRHWRASEGVAVSLGERDVAYWHI